MMRSFAGMLLILIFLFCAACGSGDTGSSSNTDGSTDTNNPDNTGNNTANSGSSYLYILGYDNALIYQYKINGTTGSLESLSPATVATEITPWDIAIHPTLNYAYVASFGSKKLMSFSINPATGQLSYLGNPVAGSFTPSFVSVHPNGKYLYSDSISQTVVKYTINASTGLLTESQRTGIPTFGTSTAFKVHPAGSFAYHLNMTQGRANLIDVYKISTFNGDLSYQSTVTVGTMLYSNADIIIHPTGKFLYVSDQVAYTGAYSINQTTGALTHINSYNDEAPTGLAFDPAGNYLYTANYMNNSVSIYAVTNTSGALSKVTSVSVGSNPNQIAVSGSFLYMCNSQRSSVADTNDISIYLINASTGRLTSVENVNLTYGGAFAFGLYSTSGRSTDPQ